MNKTDATMAMIDSLSKSLVKEMIRGREKKIWEYMDAISKITGGTPEEVLKYLGVLLAEEAVYIKTVAQPEKL